jgi:hypothetical protein
VGGVVLMSLNALPPPRQVWLVGGVVLMNLLIAMMADTFAAVTAAATAEWNLVFAGMVREGGRTSRDTIARPHL